MEPIYRTSEVLRRTAELTFPRVRASLEPGEVLKVMATCLRGAVAVTDRRLVFLNPLRQQPGFSTEIPIDQIASVHVPESSQVWGNVIVYWTGGRFKCKALPSPGTANDIIEALGLGTPPTFRLPLNVRLLQVRDRFLDWLWRMLYGN